jgi:hypothetical protein
MLFAMLKNCVLALLCLSAVDSSSAFAADASSEIPPDTEADLIGKVYQEMTQGNSLRALKSLEEFKRAHPRGEQSEAIGAYLPVIYSQIGLNQQALEAADLAYEEKPAPSPNPLKGLRPVSAFEPILRFARNSRIVMVNEAHHVAQNRVFMRDLLVKLREEGFDYFAAETLELADTGLAARGYQIL